jgi:hypothetical protein
LYERLNFQKEVAFRGETALLDREDEIRKTTIIGAELDRQIELEKQKLPLVGSLMKEMDKFENKKLELHKQSLKLGKLMENPNDPNRCRNPPGQDPTVNFLVEKIDKMEELLATQEV